MWNRTENKVTLALIRHGETQANQERRYLGRTDERLSKSGMEMLLTYKKQQLYPKISYLFSSPMKRCLETAKILYPQCKPIVIPEWTEIDFGEFEYKNYQQLKDNAKYQAWMDSGCVQAFPGGESRDDFIIRCKKGFDSICEWLQQALEQTGQKSVCAGAIVHGGTIMALLASKGGIDYYDYQVAAGRGYLCRITELEHYVRIKEIANI